MLNVNHLIGFGAAAAGGAGPGPISLVNFTTGASAGITTVAINKPAGVSVGDLMVATLCVDGNATWTTLAGWTQVTAGAHADIGIMWRVVDGTEGASFTFTGSTSNNKSGAILAYSRAAFDVLGAYSTENNDPVVMPSVTVTSNNSLLVGFCRRRNASSTFGVPSGMSLITRDNDAQAPSWGLFSESVNSGATGTRSSAGAGTPNSVAGCMFSLSNV